MEKILTPEEKKYLGKVSRYLNSLGMNYGDINFEMESDDDSISISDKEIRSNTHFSNNYTAEIPDGMHPILRKILSSVSVLDLDEVPNDAHVDFQGIEVIINVKEQSISVVHYYTWTSGDDTQALEWDGKLFDELEEDGLFEDIEVPANGELIIPYNGGGDSGYIESNFEGTTQQIPQQLEEWCYDRLEENFGGWEINEGSQGNFTIDFHDRTVRLTHTSNSEYSSSNTLWEEKF